MTVTQPTSDRLPVADEDGPGLPSDPPATPSRAGAVWRWFGRRHRLRIELLVVIGLYAVYDAARGAAAVGPSVAVARAVDVEHIERTLHVAVERPVQVWSSTVPGLMPAFDVSYMLLHLAALGAVMLWLYRCHHRGYVELRTAVLVASAASLVCFVLLPTAPPRLAGIGIADSISHLGVAEGSDTFTLFYNPYAAFPSLHEAYALLAGWGVWRYAGHRAARWAGAAYGLWVAVEVLATGNHFLMDVVAAAAVTALSLRAARCLPADPAASADAAAGGPQRNPANRSSSGTGPPVRSAARTKTSLPKNVA